MVLSAAGQGTGARLTYYDSAHHAAEASDAASSLAKGSVIVAGMKIEPEADPSPLSSKNKAKVYFAVTPANIPQNQGHVRRMVLACDKASDRDEWVRVLSSASTGELGVTLGPRAAPPDEDLSVPLRRKPRRVRLYHKERMEREEGALRLLETVVKACVRPRLRTIVCMHVYVSEILVWSDSQGTCSCLPKMLA